MKVFKKLALAAAVASVPMVGVAMEPLSDENLSSVTGQDGISIALDLNALDLNVYVEDADGVDVDGIDGAGMIAIQNLRVDTGTGPITIDIDAGGSAASAAGAETGLLQLDINLQDLTMSDAEGDAFIFGVAGTAAEDVSGNRAAADGWERVDGAKEGVTTIMSIEELALGETSLTVQLGPEAQNFLNIDADPIDELVLAGFTLDDASEAGGGQLFTDNITINNIDISGTTGSITENGLKLTLGGQEGMDIALMGLGLGEQGQSGVLGNVYVDGLNLAGSTVTISGK